MQKRDVIDMTGHVGEQRTYPLAALAVLLEFPTRLDDPSPALVTATAKHERTIEKLLQECQRKAIPDPIADVAGFLFRYHSYELRDDSDAQRTRLSVDQDLFIQLVGHVSIS